MSRRRVNPGAAGFLCTAGLMAVLYAGYGRWGGSPAAALLCPVNASVGERMKLLFVPLFLFTAVEFWLRGRDRPGFLAARAVSVLAGLAAVPALHYTYAGALGWAAPWAEAAVLLAAAGGTFWLDGRLTRRGALSRAWQQVLGLAVLWGLAFFFLWCTFRPPALPLWRDGAVLAPGGLPAAETWGAA